MEYLKTKILILFFLIYFSAILGNKDIKNDFILYKCGADSIDLKAKPATLMTKIDDRSPEYQRRLDTIDEDGFKNFSIYLDLYNFEDEIIKYKLNNIRELLINGMNKAIKTLTSLLKVKSSKYNYLFTDEQIKNIGINNWDKDKIGNKASLQLHGFYYFNIDLYIFARLESKNIIGGTTLASAGVAYIDNESGRPLIGLVNINKDIDYTKEKSKEYFESIIIHEFTHILGFSFNFFIKYFHNLFIRNDKYGIFRAYINSTKVVNVARKYFNCKEIDGVELEESGGDGTSGSHWEARILLGEYMNGVLYTEEQVISEFTLALLEDSGYYKANYYTGGLMRYGKNKGCDFVFNKCVINGEINSKFKNEFFNSINNDITYMDTSCSSGRQSRTYNYLVKYQKNSIPEKYQYFSDPETGGWSAADYCPVSLVDKYNEGKNIYYVGHCSEKGSGEYGQSIPYKKGKEEYNYYASEDIMSITGEVLSDHSFCVLSSLKLKNIKFDSNVFRAVCYQMFCSEKSLTILILNNYIVCPRSGGKIKVEGFDGYLICPDYNLICSGTVLCNDMFDCVDKKSQIKEDIYDYEIKTSQDIDDIEDDKIIKDSYELSEDGKCPKFCRQCNELGQCIKCRSDYKIVEKNENNSTIIKTQCIKKKLTKTILIIIIISSVILFALIILIIVCIVKKGSSGNILNKFKINIGDKSNDFIL